MIPVIICEHLFSGQTANGYSAVGMDIGARRTTKDGYGRLTIRHDINNDVWEVFDIHNDEVIERDSDLEQLADRAERFTIMGMDIKYAHETPQC